MESHSQGPSCLLRFQFKISSTVVPFVSSIRPSSFSVRVRTSKHNNRQQQQQQQFNCTPVGKTHENNPWNWPYLLLCLPLLAWQTELEFWPTQRSDSNLLFKLSQVSSSSQSQWRDCSKMLQSIARSYQARPMRLQIAASIFNSLNSVSNSSTTSSYVLPSPIPYRPFNCSCRKCRCWPRSKQQSRNFPYSQTKLNGRICKFEFRTCIIRWRKRLLCKI